MIAEIKDAARAVMTLPQLLAGLQEAIREGHETLPPGEDLPGRVSALEREMRGILADAEALVTRAESRFSAARAAEERARGMQKRAEELAGAEEGDEEGLDPFLRAARAHVQASNGGGSPEGGVHDVQPDMDVPRHRRGSSKAAARAAKFGG